jgi:hypothetical protein
VSHVKTVAADIVYQTAYLLVALWSATRTVPGNIVVSERAAKHWARIGLPIVGTITVKSAATGFGVMMVTR